MSTITLLENGATFGTQRGRINTNFTNLNTDKAERSNVLEKTNSSPFTPSATYHPATKGYVDSSISSLKDLLDPNGYGVDAFDRANHTGTQAATTIVTDPLHRFATDAEKASWTAKEPAISKNTAFNKNFGPAHDQVAYGDHTHSEKANKSVPATEDSIALLNSAGDLADSGKLISDLALATEKVPIGGSTGQRLGKVSNSDNDVSWLNKSVAYRDIISKSGSTEILSSIWAGNVIIWTLPTDSTLTLPQTSTEAISAGFTCKIFNNSSTYNLSFAIQGSDSILIQGGIVKVPPQCFATITKLISGSPNTWQIEINYNTVSGYGEMSTSGAIAYSVVSASTWEEIPIASTAAGTLNNFTITAEKRLKLGFTNHGGHTTDSIVNVTAGIEYPVAARTIDLSFGINGVVFTNANILFNRGKSSGSLTSGLVFPFAFSFKCPLVNGDEISAWIRSSLTGTINIQSLSIQVQSKAIIGVDYA